jgi:pimeloyl-ACP methyl ester carboxylesterase
VLAGHSWGAIVIQLLAWRRPDLVAGLVLVDPAHEQMTEDLPKAARPAIRLARFGRGDELRSGDTPASTAMLRELRMARAGTSSSTARATASIRTGQMPSRTRSCRWWRRYAPGQNPLAKPRRPPSQPTSAGTTRKRNPDHAQLPVQSGACNR